jgi:hypothetical protein
VDQQTKTAILMNEMIRSVKNMIARFSGKKKMTLQAALKSGAVEAVSQMTTNGIQVQFKKTAQAGSGVLELSFVPGSILENTSGQYSGLVVTKVIGRATAGQRYLPGPISLTDSEPVVYAVDGYLAAIKDLPPNSGFSVSKAEPGPELACVAGQTQLPPGAAVQVAIWMETASLSATQWQQARQRLPIQVGPWLINEENFSKAESLVAQCKAVAH